MVGDFQPVHVDERPRLAGLSCCGALARAFGFACACTAALCSGWTAGRSCLPVVRFARLVRAALRSTVMASDPADTATPSRIQGPNLLFPKLAGFCVADSGAVCLPNAQKGG